VNATYPSGASEALAAERRLLGKTIAEIASTQRHLTSEFTTGPALSKFAASQLATPLSAYAPPSWLTNFESTFARVAEQNASFTRTIDTAQRQAATLAGVTALVHEIREAAASTVVIPPTPTLESDLEELHDEARSAIADADEEIRGSLEQAVEELEQLEQTVKAASAGGERAPWTRTDKLTATAIVVALVIGHRQVLDFADGTGRAVSIVTHYAMALLAWLLQFPDSGSIA
jgi:hypothetical protein